MSEEIITNQDGPSNGTLTKGDGSISAAEVKQNLERKIDNVNLILLSVVVILIVMVATLIIDSFHINSATYKEYSEKTEVLNALLESNKALMDQHTKNQEFLLQQQSQTNQSLRANQSK